MSSRGDNAALPGTLATEHRFEMPVGRPAIWALISDVDAYQEWWPWLRVFEAGGLTAGDKWSCEVQPPLPYAVRFQVLIDQVEAPLEVRARIEGDVVYLRLEGSCDGCPASATTLKLAVERAILERVPEIREVRAVA